MTFSLRSNFRLPVIAGELKAKEGEREDGWKGSLCEGGEEGERE